MIITEPTEKENTKSVGCWFIESAVKNAGYDIRYIDYPDIENINADIYLFSVHHVSDMFYLSKIIDKKKGVWIGGGHAMNNPYPFLHFFDLICVGEGEIWILKVLEIFSKRGTIKDCLEIPGSLVLQNVEGEIEKQYINDISRNDIYLNESFKKGHKDTWYLEIGRGCKSKCFYCELGWTNKYRENQEKGILEKIDFISKSNVNRINIFAPDDYSASFYENVCDLILDKNLISNFGSMRVDRLLKMNSKQKKNFLFRMGVDGLSERIRRIVNKNIENEKLIRLFREMVNKDYKHLKFFFIFSYPFETKSDFNEFIYLTRQLHNEARNILERIIVRLKFTPLIPNLHTPLEDFKPYYDNEMKNNILQFFAAENGRPGKIYFKNDGIMNESNYYIQAFLSRARYEEINLKLIKNFHRLKLTAKELAISTKPHGNLKLHINSELLKKAKNKLHRRINAL